MPVVHCVKRGECVSSIAYNYGFFTDTIWEHSENAGLRQSRDDGNILFEGDELFIPDKRVKEVPKPTDQEHRFRLKGVPAKFSLRFVDEGRPRDNVPYRLIVHGRQFTGKTDGDGMLKAVIPPNAVQGKLLLGEAGEEQEFVLHFGELDPLDTDAGILQRLRHLGFACPHASSVKDEDAQAAIHEFQCFIGHPDPTGKLDEQTRHILSSLNERP